MNLLLRPSLCTLGLVATCLLTACRDEGEAPEPAPTQQYPTLPYRKLTLTETFWSDAEPVTLTQQFDCTEGLLTRYTARQSVQASDEVVLLESTTQLQYQDSVVTATDDRGNTYRYLLNLQGYATRCLLNEGSERQRSYTFTYQVNTEQEHYLTSIVEQLADGTEHSRLTLDYASYRHLLLTQSVGGATQSFRLTTSPQGEMPNAAQVPCLFLTERHPLSEHLPALYGKLLGEPGLILVESVEPDGGDPLSYTYVLDHRGWPIQVTASSSDAGSQTVNYNFE